MNEMITTFRGALMLDTKTFSDLKASPDVFRKGITILVVIGLIVGLVTALVGTAQGLLANPAADLAQARATAEQQMKQFMPPEASAMFLDNMSMGFRIAERIVRETKSPLPHPVRVVFQQIGVMVSYPFGWLSSLLLYGALVHIAARLLGGRGTIAQMLGLTALTVAPYILSAVSVILNAIPYAGGCLTFLIGLVEFFWGIVIYVKGTAVAHEMSGGRALMAVLLPIIVAVLVALLVLVLFIILIVASTGGR